MAGEFLLPAVEFGRSCIFAYLTGLVEQVYLGA